MGKEGVAEEIEPGVSGVESVVMREYSVLGMTQRRPRGPAGAGCASALLAYYAVIVVLG